MAGCSVPGGAASVSSAGWRPFRLLVLNNYWLASRIAYVIRRIRIQLGLEK